MAKLTAGEQIRLDQHQTNECHQPKREPQEEREDGRSTKGIHQLEPPDRLTWLRLGTQL